MTKLNQHEIDERLKNLHQDWIQEGDSIKRDFVFDNFVRAFGFMTAVAIEADNADHHPNWKNVYNKVSISLSTHDAGGLTDQDFDLAIKIDKLYNNWFNQLIKNIIIIILVIATILTGIRSLVNRIEADKHLKFAMQYQQEFIKYVEQAKSQDLMAEQAA